MAPKAHPDPMARGPSSSSKSTADPMLQGTYEQDESNDVELSTDEIAAFEGRLEHQRGGGQSAAALNVSRTRESGVSRRLSAPVASHAHQPHPSSSTSLSAALGAADTAWASSHRAADRGMSEEERAAQIQHGADVEDVRRLEDRFGGGNDDDSDDETVARWRKMGL
ncbi:hypothetical protein Q4I30_005367 [Leishmania utingensis]|uniref:Uncharacterized protein n=1 Tax=Leishmania utingensis TaxID=653362 RepID=A0AAW3A8H0_9TRYP